MAIQKTYQYKTWSPSGTYLGLIQNVTSDFNYNQLIASIGTQVQFSVALSADTAGQAVTNITDETGQNTITTEDGNPLQIERQPDAVGSGNSLAQISNNNQIQIWEFSDYYPNGLLKFSGYISKWKASFGTIDDILVTCLNNGQDLSQYLVQSGNSAAITQNTDNGTTYNLIGTGSKDLSFQGVCQNFVGASNFSMGGITIEVATTEPGQLGISVQNGTLSNGTYLTTAIASGTLNLGIVSKSTQTINFNVPTSIVNGNSYNFAVSWQPTNSNSTTPALIYANTGNPYASGDSGITAIGAGFSTECTGINTGSDLYFVILSHGTGVTGSYTNQDPTFMLTDIMDTYISRGGYVGIPNTVITPLIQQLNNDNSITDGYWGNGVAQIFTPTTNLNVNILNLYLGVSSGSYSMSWSIYKGNPALDTASVSSGLYTYTVNGANSFVASSNTTTFSNTSPGVVTFEFSSPVNLTAGQKYYILWTTGQGSWGNLEMKGASSGDTISDTQVGNLYQSIATINNAGANPAYSSTYPAIYFAFAYVNPLPASLTSGYNNTGVSTSYTFKIQTILQAIQSIDSLAPANWYWYVDPATNILYWQAANVVADITIIKGKHINTLDLTATKEGIKNNVYLTGGDDGTNTSTNIFVNINNGPGTGRVGLALLNDNRINGGADYLGSQAAAIAVANQVVSEYINDNAVESYVSNITIQDQTMDINKFRLGQMLGFSGFGTFVDNLLLQIVGLNYSPDQVTLQLGTLPTIQSIAVQQLEALLQNSYTQNNPVSPSA